MENTNEMTIIFDSYSSNEAFARVAVAAFMTSLNPTVEEVADVKTAVSEAVTNAIIHGYESRIEKITLRCKTCGDTLYIEIEDHGKGMEDVKKAMEPLFTTRPELDRSGMGFSFMEAFMDQVEVSSKPEKAYFNCHTDITIPYDEIGSISAVSEDGSETVIIENGRFVLAGCEELNKPFLK